MDRRSFPRAPQALAFTHSLEGGPRQRGPCRLIGSQAILVRLPLWPLSRLWVWLDRRGGV